VHVVTVETARAMQKAVEEALPADIAVMAAAVADWRTEESPEKLKKDRSGSAALQLIENPDILAGVSRHPQRPRLVIGFAAETQDLLANAQAKLKKKGADWIVANDVSPASGIMGGALNRVHIISAKGVESWPEMSKQEVAKRLVERIAEELNRR
jgi:phosphopantothenoylcysteine decarboxylase/phosphopantothenate--cysteine ligase